MSWFRALGVFCIIFTSTAPHYSSASTYLVTTPKFIRPGVRHSVAVSLLKDSPSQVRVTADIFNGKVLVVSGEDTLQQGSTKLLVLPPIPMDSTADESQYTLLVNGYDGVKQVFTDSTSLVFHSKRFSTFIQTDKSQYKPRQGVKIRVISLYSDLKPYKAQVNIVVKDPQGNFIEQWLSIDSHLGVVSKEFQLSDNPPLGSWTIEATVDGVMSSSPFIVAQYVLPKFEVEMRTQSIYYVPDMEDINGTVTAKYTYGKPVNGTLTVTLSLNAYIEGMNINITKTMPIDGSADFSFSYADFDNYTRYREMEFYYYQPTALSVTATVTESLTGITRNTSTAIGTSVSKYNLQFYGNPSVLRPSLNFTAYLKLTSYNNKSLTTEERKNNVTISVSQATYLPSYSGKEVFRMFKNNSDLPGPDEELDFKQFLNDSGLQEPGPTESIISYAVPENGIITINLPIMAKATSLNIEAQFQGFRQYLYISAFHSPSNSYVQIQKPSSTPKVGTPFQLTVESNELIKELQYTVVSRGQVVAVGKETSASFLVTPTDSWAPTACMIVYYVRDDGEVVNDFLELSISSVFKNKVSLSWSKTQVKPSESVSLGVTVTEPMSLVGILVVDKSAQLLQNGNDITGDMVVKEQAGYDAEDNNYFYGQPPADPLSVFQKCNLLVMTDAEVHNYYQPIFYMVRPELVMKELDKSSEPRVRTYFPETWIWLDTNTSASTNATLNVIVPDSITSWVASAFVISEGLGLGLTSSPAELEVFQPFFLSLNLPYSVIRGEQFVLEVTIFNYLDQALEATVTVDKSDALEFNVSGNSANAVDNKQKVSVPSQNGITVLFPIKPKQLGEIAITVKATSPAASDAVTQTVLVKAEGIEQSFSQSLLLDLVGNGQQTVSKDVNFTFPADVVKGSERAYLTLVGDLLGPSIAGLESLIQMPYGCGEQNMINFAPNIYVLQYLIKTKQVKEDIKTKAISFMTQGYQRELTYQRMDGSFSAFGDGDSSGSTWLSAFVLRCFLQARQFIYIDPTVLSKTIEWIIPQQNPTGEFREPGRVIHSELQGGQNGPLSLTAYVLMALLEDETYKSYYQSAVLGAVSYLENWLAEGISNNYTLSLVTYALSLANSTLAKTALDELNSRAEKDGGLMFWSSPMVGGSHFWQPRSTDIELASYALLSHLKQKRLAEGIPVMKWLSQQRNHLGGYSSTQDTVIALQALSGFAALSMSQDVGLTVTVSGTGLTFLAIFHIDSTNLLLLQKQQIEVQQSMSVNVKAVGNGFAIFQFNVFYNVKNKLSRRRRDTGNQEGFDLSIAVIDNVDDLNHVSLHICTRLLENQNMSQSGMVLMEVGLLSGFILVEDGIATNEMIKKVETGSGKVFLYLDSLSTSQVCLDIPAIRDSKISNAQDAVVLIYDYYEPSRMAVRTYRSEVMQSISSCDFCGKDCELCRSNVMADDVTTAGSAAVPIHYTAVVTSIFAGVLFLIQLI
ncbi:CD109 antigen-like [Acipenser ruthenus]|uniref:CD109 antigen-like n=1 Tax=Acipenser ruthenus TaxID=7906 RepID=UPI0027427CA6|nr:CD109 antigen-like [Acipenser ruthenus]